MKNKTLFSYLLLILLGISIGYFIFSPDSNSKNEINKNNLKGRLYAIECLMSNHYELRGDIVNEYLDDRGQLEVLQSK